MDNIDWWRSIEVAVAVILLLWMFLGSFFTVETQHVGIVQRLGKFRRAAPAGLNFKLPLLDHIVDDLSLQIEQIAITAESKTKDNVFIALPIAVQFKINPERVFDAYYLLDDPEPQIKAYVANCILGHIPNMNLAEVFEKQASISQDVLSSLTASMAQFGYDIVRAQITDINPPPEVVKALNGIVAAASDRQAAESRAEINKITTIKAAEAEAQSKKLQGEGIANERTAIIEGLSKSIKDFEHEVGGTTAEQALALVLLTQYFDTLKAIGAGGKATAILLPHSPGGIADLAAQLREAVTAGGLVTRAAQA